MNHKSYNSGEVIFREGSFGETMYEITSGSVAIIARYGTPDEQRLATLGVGEIFGEMGLVEYYERSATAVALEDGTSVDEIGSDEFIAYLQHQPDRVLSIMGQLSARVKATKARYDEACRTVYDAIEVEKAGVKRERDLRTRLSDMIRAFTHSA